ncbi:MAG TPA: hypothetical protein VF443_02975, partial [Nitrospira sp.]
MRGRLSDLTPTYGAWPWPYYVYGHCGEAFHNSFVSTYDAAHGTIVAGGSSYCGGHFGCSNTTDIYLPGPAKDISFDLMSSFVTQVSTDGFRDFFPKPATPFVWTRVVIPASGGHIQLTTTDAGYHDVYYNSSHYIDNLVFTPAPPAVPTFAFQFDANQPGQRVLLHKYRQDDHSGPFGTGYFSVYQDTDRQFHFPGQVDVDGVGTAKTIYVHVLDPPDTAAYVPVVDRKQGDNRDPVRPRGQLFYKDAQGNRIDAPPGGVLSMMADSDGVPGRANIYLETSENMSGENYQLEASFDPNFTCASAGPNGTDICAKSVVVTTWKRVYVEVNKMFRRGAFLTADVQSGDKVIHVDDVRGLPNPPFKIRLLHSPPVEGTGSFLTTEEVTIVGLNAMSGGIFARLAGQRNPGDLLIDADPAVPAIQHRYAGSDIAKGIVRPYLADAVGSVTGVRGADYYLANATLVNNAFADAFVEHVWMTDAGPGDSDLRSSQPRLYWDGVFPFRHRLNETDEWEHIWMTRKWLQTAKRSGVDREALPNQQSFFVAARYVTREWNQPPVDTSQRGLTYAGDSFNDSWVFTEALGTSPVIGEGVVHELTHEWRVNPPPFG